MSSLSDSVNSLRFLGRAGHADIAVVVVERLVDCCNNIIRCDKGVEEHVELVYILSDLLQLKSEFVLFGHAVAQETSLQERFQMLDGGEDYARPILDVLQEVNVGRAPYKRPRVQADQTPAQELQGGDELSDALLEALARIVERVAARKPVQRETRRQTYLSLQLVMHELQELLAQRRTMLFEQIFEMSDSRERVVLSFLAILVLTKMGIVHINQQGRFGDIIVEYVGKRDG